MKYFRRILPYLRPYKKMAVSSVVLIFVGSVFNLLTPWPLKILVDYVLAGKPLPYGLNDLLGAVADNKMMLLALTVIAGFLITVLVQAIGVLDNYVNTRLDLRMALDFRTDLFEHAQKLSLAYHDQNRAGNLIFAINSQADAASRLIMTIPPVAQSAITLVGMAWITWKMDWQLTFVALGVAPLLWFTTSYYMKHIHKRTADVRAMEGESLSIIHEAVTMMRVIVAFGRERFELRRFRSQSDQAVDARVALTVRQSLFNLAVNAITAGGTALVLGLGFYHALQNRITMGDLLVMISYFAMIYTPLATISTTVGGLQEVLVSLEIAFGLLDTKPEIQDMPGAVSIRRAEGHVVFENVNFSYEGRGPTLQDVSLDAKRGQVIAIVGPTGAGKSTLISLIPRFYEPAGGRILLDGRDIRTLTLRSLRNQISLVLQEPLLFSGTIASNIRYGRSDAKMEQIYQAARAASAHDFISALPNGYETVIGERGSQLSGGERQRIAVARAFLRDTPLLILDEPTSSIDSKTEGVILDALDRLMVGRTTFIIAHRLSTIRKADVILVLENGRIIERGSEQELLRVNGVYRKLHAFQRGVEETDDFDGLALASGGGTQ
jgi:ATP-binding cassette subfamily B protein